MSDKVIEEPGEAWVIECCVLGREETGPWRVAWRGGMATKENAKRLVDAWNAERPAHYSYRHRRYVPTDWRPQVTPELVRRVRAFVGQARSWHPANEPILGKGFSSLDLAFNALVEALPKEDPDQYREPVGCGGGHGSATGR